MPATREYAGERHDTIRRTLTELYGEQAGQAVPLLYGGSVNPDNAVGLIRMENIDGLFIGRSAWDAPEIQRHHPGCAGRRRRLSSTREKREARVKGPRPPRIGEAAGLRVPIRGRRQKVFRRR